MAAREPLAAGGSDSDDSMNMERPTMSTEQSVACDTNKDLKSVEKECSAEGTSEQVPLRILLLGRGGSGKSSSGNTILGQKLFRSPKRYKERVTTTCEEQTCHVAGKEVCVIDTPDLLDPDVTEDQLSLEKEKLLSVCQAGLHAVLLVVPIGKDLQNEEEMLEFAKGLLGHGLVNFVILLFTMGDQLEDDETLEDYVQNKENELRSLIQKCGKRIHVFSNNDKDRSQVTDLIEKINHMVSTRGVFRRTRNPGTNENFPGPDQPSSQIRVVLLGKTGVGKSASGNTILGRRIFQSDVSSASQTKQCSLQKTARDGREISVIDTPGLFDNVLSNEEVTREILKCLTLASPGPHAFLIVIRLGRFTQEEKSTVQAIKELFGENATKYMMVLFTYKDELHFKTVEEFLRDGDEDLKQLVKDCDERFHSFDNKSQNYNQFTEFVAKIDNIVSKNENNYYKSQLFQDIEQEIQAIQEKKLDEKVKRYKEDNPDIPNTEWQQIFWKLVEESRNEAQENVFKEMCAVMLAKLSGRLSVTAAEKESAIEAIQSKGISRSKALRLAVKATRKLAVKKVCKIQ